VYSLRITGCILNQLANLLNGITHCFAIDNQVYMTLKPCDNWDDNSSSIEACAGYRSI